MRELLRAALVIARRDYIATIWSRTFILFLLGPLLPLAFGALIGGVGGEMEQGGGPIRIAVAGSPEARVEIAAARARLADGLGEDALPALASRQAGVVLHDPFGQPRLSGPAAAIEDAQAPVALILNEALRQRQLARHGLAPPPVIIKLERLPEPPHDDAGGQRNTARGAQLLLVVLTLILAGMLLSNLIEEKSNKVIEVLAAAVPVDAIFLGKLAAMLAMSLTAIAAWGGGALLAIHLLLPGHAALTAPAVGWPAFVVLGIAYFTTNYLLLGAFFLGIGARATTVRQVQTLSMPATMGQLVLLALAAHAVSAPDGGLAIAASVLPWSSAYAMLARAAERAALWPHLLAIVWQMLWVVLSVRLAARSFRRGVLLSGRPGKAR